MYVCTYFWHSRRKERRENDWWSWIISHMVVWEAVQAHNCSNKASWTIKKQIIKTSKCGWCLLQSLLFSFSSPLIISQGVFGPVVPKCCLRAVMLSNVVLNNQKTRTNGTALKKIHKPTLTCYDFAGRTIVVSQGQSIVASFIKQLWFWTTIVWYQRDSWASSYCFCVRDLVSYQRAYVRLFHILKSKAILEFKTLPPIYRDTCVLTYMFRC